MFLSDIDRTGWAFSLGHMILVRFTSGSNRLALTFLGMNRRTSPKVLEPAQPFGDSLDEYLRWPGVVCVQASRSADFPD